MALTVNSMYTKYKTALVGCGITFNDDEDCIIKALFTAIIDEIQTNLTTTSSGCHDGHTDGVRCHDHSAGSFR